MYILYIVVVVVVSHIQRFGCKPEQTTFLQGVQSRSWSAEQGNVYIMWTPSRKAGRRRVALK